MGGMSRAPDTTGDIILGLGCTLWHLGLIDDDAYEEIEDYVWALHSDVK